MELEYAMESRISLKDIKEMKVIEFLEDYEDLAKVINERNKKIEENRKRQRMTSRPRRRKF